jgi:serine/threonine protein kinase/tetratricopeptide (TPR) repeat protein
VSRIIGHYEVTGTLGEGGMGIVYAARDARLNRSVALKMIRVGATGGDAAERLRREARSAAAVSHPNVCQLYELGEEEGTLFIAMELLQGESLASRIARGALPPREAVAIALEMLSALEALHTAGVMHRDLKPSNIFLTPHGVKLLDFGLACGATVDDETRLTRTGTMMGTPQYMSPEQVQGQPADARADIFAAGAILYEMLTGRAAFTGRTLPEIVHAIAYESPPALGGSPAVAAIDRVIHTALVKRPEERYRSAAAMAEALRGLPTTETGPVITVRQVTRLIVLPFRVLRADPEIDFLAFSLPDALTTSLSGLDSLVVRSSLAAARFAAEVDLETIAAKADVDAVLTGTLLRSGDQLRVTAQLTEAPSGTVRWSHTAQMPIGDIFQLQDTLTTRIVSSLAVPLTARDERALKRDVPATAKAYEFYLRANQIAYEAKNWVVARDLYRQCLDEDPSYAPGWARLGRIYRVLAMYGGEGSDANYAAAEEAFTRALDLNPELSIAHNLYTVVEIELGRAREAMLRLLERSRAQSSDPELFAGLVQACRYAGLEGPSIAAHEHARRFDPQMRTAVNHTYLTASDYERVIATDEEDPPMTAMLALDLLGRTGEAAARLRPMITPGMPPLFRLMLEIACAVFEKDYEAGTAAADRLLPMWKLRDPCANYYLARSLAALRHPHALDALDRAVRGGFNPFSFLQRDPWLDSLREEDRFKDLLAYAGQHYRETVAAFIAAGGERVLGPVN